MWPDCSPPTLQPVRAHVLDDIAVADRGAMQLQADAAEEALEAEIGHDRRDDAAAGQPARAVPGFGDQRHQLVAVDHGAVLVDDHHPVGVAVERDADIGAHLVHLLGQIARMRSSRIRG